MKEHSIIINKTARYYTLGEINHKTRYVWIVLHGYGYHAGYFIKKFLPVLKPDTFIVAPEGLNKFYKEGFSGNVGATWMTKEDRLNEINDYVNYLNLLFKNLNKQLKGVDFKLVTVGFSQGGTTLIRWLNSKVVKTDYLILWGSRIPDDFDFSNNKDLFSHSKNLLYVGREDPFLNYIDVDRYNALINEHHINFETIWYNGKHNIPATDLLDFEKKYLRKA